MTGMTFGEIEASALTVSAFVVAFLGSVALWWIYFDIAEGLARMILSSSEDQGRVALSAYTYSHIPMIAGISRWPPPTNSSWHIPACKARSLPLR